MKICAVGTEFCADKRMVRQAVVRRHTQAGRQTHGEVNSNYTILQMWLTKIEVIALNPE